MLKLNTVQFVKSAMDWRDAPEIPLPEIAFVGRSNVGKSSLINALINKKNMARVSKQPGKTRSLNFFLVNEQFYLVDLPGYGFAKIAKEEQEKWRLAIEGYLTKGPHLKMLFVLIDSKVGAKSNDAQLIDWLRFNNIPHGIICTKVDRISKNTRSKQASAIRRALGLQTSQPLIFFSAKTKEGREDLWAAIEMLLQQK